MRATFKLYENRFKLGSYIFVAKEGINNNDFSKLKKDFNFALKKMDLLK